MSDISPEAAFFEARDVGAAIVRRHWAAILAFAYLAVLALWVAFPSAFTIHDPLGVAVTSKLLPPSAEHWFGTDHLGRDVLTRIIFGTQNSLMATLIAVLIGLVVGSAVGLISGFGPERLDAAIMRVVDVLLAIPNLLLSLAIVTALGFGLVPVAIAVGIGSVGSFARIMRSEVIRVKKLPFVESARLLGASPADVAIRHVLPHSWGPVVALSAIEFGAAVLSVSALSFLGFGAPPPEIEWGLLVSEGRKFISAAWWLIAFPSLFIVLTVVAANVVGQFLEERLGQAY
ncbi:ABC transporter permease (plasmid) [Agrobacterium tumefaciens]|uniref:ABC transporter permease n=1 Tax=Agrobacterium tumefaciens TaxID=358 RepID=A0AAP9J9D9_AGRTU|nr:ABC transporter permease [Agrobacterium tumefaciens]NSZ60133.1 ABC transporter permease [Agrobacterium tumefaciens]NTZ64202.1 ABC transporter permease [Agrobacterium tumefaciens]QDY97729.1 ABC transporter permease [Agrobacterium tumefaciens]UXS12852.1 ABC transporter permease [Agrobacterium tumefaciens]UXS20214.1 ABC transporter permease [Agrobacterium tumefaciens]